MLFDGKQFLCLKFNMGRIVKTKDTHALLKQRVLKDSFKFLILSNPTGDLEQTQIEGESIKKFIIHKDRNIDVDFKSVAINKLFVAKNICEYDFIHYSGHCEYNSVDFKDTGWVLKDGIFNCRDIQSLAEDNCLPTLVFSNGCFSATISTSIPKKDYQKIVFGIAQSFIFSGVNHYIGSIVSVEDKSANIFAQSFYKFLLQGNSVGSSIRLSRLEFIEKYGLGCLHWASYVLYGDPNYKYLFLNKSIRFRKKKVKKLFLFVFFILILFIAVVVFNPRNFILELQIEKLLRKGDNKKVITLIKKENSNYLKFKFYPSIALAYERSGKNEEAVKYYFDYAVFSEKRRNFIEVASTYLKIGWIYHKLGDYLKAMEFYIKAKDISEKNKDNMNLAISLRKQAVLYMDKQDDNKALELLTRSAEINRDHSFSFQYRYNLACDYFDLGLLFTNKNDLVTAKDFYTKRLNLFKNIKEDDELSDCYFNLGEIYLFEKSYGLALDCYFKGLEIDLKHRNIPNIASDYNMIAELYLDIEDFEKAYKYLKNAQELYNDFNSPVDLANLYYNFGVYYKKKMDKNKSHYYFELALNLYKTLGISEELKVKKQLDLL